MKRVATATLLISVLSVFPSKAQYTVQGLLLSESSQPIAYANAALLDPNDSSMVGGGISDEKGEFTIEKVEKGEYLLLCSLLGFTSHSQRLDISSDISLNEIYMEERTPELEEVVVQGQRPAFEMTSSALVVNVSSSPVLQSGNLLQMMGRLPGISFGQNNSLQYKGNANVMVIINGKQTYLSQEQLSNLLENTPAENVEKVELMDNPPAKYDAAGTAGMINIVLKKPEDLGSNGTVSINIGQGRFEKVNPSISLNHRTAKINLFGTYSYNYNKTFREMEISRNLAHVDLETGESLGGTTTIDQLPYWIYPRQSHNFSFGTDWFVGNKTTLGLLVNGTAIVYVRKDHAVTSLSGEYQNRFDQTETFTNTDINHQNINMNLNFKHEFGNGGVLNFDVDNGLWDNENASEINTRYLDDNSVHLDESLTLTNAMADIAVQAFQIDYNQKLGDYNMETGLKMSIVKSDNDFRLSVVDDASSFVMEEDAINRFIYEEQISAAYFSLKRKWSSSWEIQAGLRAENTRSTANSVEMDSIADREYLNLFPNLSLGRDLGNNQGFTLTYSRRINRPNYQDLNPFESMSDPFTYYRGNPFLNPEIANAYGLNYRLKNRFFWVTNLRHTNDAIGFIMEQDPGRQPFFLTRRNFSKIRNFNTTLVGLFDITPWWSTNITLTGIHLRTKSAFLEDSKIDMSMASFQGKIQNTINLPRDISMEVSSQYSSPIAFGGWITSSRYRTDIGFSKKLGNSNLRLSVDDIFNNWDWTYVLKAGPIDTKMWDNYESRVIRLNFSHRFGNEKVKQARKRKTASEEIQERAEEN